MLNNRMILEIWNDEWALFKKEDIEKASEIIEILDRHMSLTGYYVNALYDELIEETGRDASAFFYKVVEEVEEEFVPMFENLYYKESIEGELKRYIINNYESILDLYGVNDD